MIDLSRLGDRIQSVGAVARVVIARHAGSTPRETGVSMLVWADGQEGTIGGGQLEFRAVAFARDLLARNGTTEVTRRALGPDLGQCCGGSVTLVTEVWDAARYRQHVDVAPWPFPGLFVRRVEGAGEMPDRLRRRLAAAAADGRPVPVQLVDGWLVEQVWQDRRPVYIYGAGHVGQALARVLAPLPQFEVAVADVRPDQMDALPAGVGRFRDVAPAQVMAAAPPDAAHLIMTPDHDYDLELCHTVLQQPFFYAGLIGSATKWARFRKRLALLGHRADQIARITCPIGDPRLGKHPHAIAIGVAAELITAPAEASQLEDIRA